MYLSDLRAGLGDFSAIYLSLMSRYLGEFFISKLRAGRAPRLLYDLRAPPLVAPGTRAGEVRALAAPPPCADRGTHLVALASECHM